MTVINLPAVRKRSFTHPVNYQASDLTFDFGDTRVARNGDRRVARNGDVRVAHRVATLGTRQIKQARKRNFTLPVVVVE